MSDSSPSWSIASPAMSGRSFTPRPASTRCRRIATSSSIVAGQPQILVAQGAAHVFKFAALVGKILADLAVRGETRYPIDAFAATRAALSDPAYELALHM